MNKIILITIIFIMATSSKIIFDFNKNANLSSWRVLDDVVMGGRSDGSFKINKKGNAEFSGNVSLANNGGFSSVRYQTSPIDIENYTKVVLVVKGDGKEYQFRVKNNVSNYYSYIKTFNTVANEWHNVEINLAEMYPAFRGRKLDLSNFSSKTIEEIAILIGNKKNESFKLEIDKIYLK